MFGFDGVGDKMRAQIVCDVCHTRDELRCQDVFAAMKTFTAKGWFSGLPFFDGQGRRVNVCPVCAEKSLKEVANG